MKAEVIKEKIENKLTNCTAMIETDDTVHFDATIICDEFNNIKNPVKRQQLIFDIIGEYISLGEIHAFSMKTFSKQEYNKYK